MTAGLRDKLQKEAQTAKTYDVYARSLATARRTRRRTAVTWAAVVAVLALAVPLLPRPHPQPVTPADGTAWSLPDRLGLPAFGSAGATEKPLLDAASVLFTGASMRFGGAGYDTPNSYAVVGSTSEEYRTLRVDTTGEPALLSPDGTIVATSAGLIDLRTGDAVPSQLDGGGTPVAWSPDGRRLLISGDVLMLADLDNRTAVDLGGPDQSVSAAWSPDGNRLAYTRSGLVVVVDETGQELASFTPPGNTRLAGKGAWLPDGSAFAMLSTDSTTWSPRWFTPETGQEVTGPALPPVPGSVTSGGILGWRPDGSALAFVYGYPTYENPQAGTPPRAFVLTPGTTQAVKAFDVPSEVTDLDIADRAIKSGHTREGDPPFPIGPKAWPWFLGGLLVVALLFFLIWRFFDSIRAQLAASPWNPHHEPG